MSRCTGGNRNLHFAMVRLVKFSAMKHLFDVGISVSLEDGLGFFELLKLSLRCAPCGDVFPAFSGMGREVSMFHRLQCEHGSGRLFRIHGERNRIGECQRF